MAGKCWDIYKSTFDQGIPPNYKLFKSVVESQGEKSLQTNGLEILEAMQAFKLTPTSTIQNHLVRAWRSKLPDHVADAFWVLHTKGVLLSSTAYRCVMVVYERNTPERTLELYETAHSTEVRLDRLAFNAAMVACTQLTKADQALQVFEHMKAWQVPPNGKTYGLLIRACTVDNQVDRAMGLFTDMQESGIIPNRFAYHDVILCCLKLRKLDEALAYFDKMSASEVVPSDLTFQYLHAACERHGWTESAARVTADFKRLKASGGSKADTMDMDAADWGKELASLDLPEDLSLE